MICWFLLVPAGVPVLVSLLLSSLVPVLVSLLLSSFFPQERGSVPSWFAGSSWFRLGFRCLSPFFSLLSFLRKGVLFHHDLLVPLGSGWGFGACLPSSLFFGSVALSPFFSLLSFLRKGVLFHHDLLVLPGSGWGSGACLPSSLFFGSGACLPSSLFFLSSGQGFCSIMICWFLLVPAGVPVLVSLLLSSLVPVLVSPSLFFLSSGKGFCSIMICWFLLVPAGVPVLVSLLLSSLVPVLVSLLLSSFFPQDRGSVPSWFLLGFRCLSPFFSLLSFLRKGVLFHHDSGRGFGACLPSSLFSLLWFRCLSPFFSLLSFLRKGVLFHHDLLVPAGVPVLVSLLLSSFFN